MLVFPYIYGLLALPHLVIQMFLAHMDHRQQEHEYFGPYLKENYQPSATVVIPVFREKPELLQKCIDSILAQDYPSLKVLVIDDGSPNIAELNAKVYNHLKDSRYHLLRLSKNVGKRRAQKHGFDVAGGEIIVTVDSDTILRDTDAVAKLVKRFKDPQVGAATGDVRVENRTKNILTRLISLRYWMAFNQERAAQSRFGVLMCCSGPFSAYRALAIEAVKERYVSQKFFGKLCTFGDDRHLTNLVLEEGHKVVFDKEAIAYTAVPENLSDYLRQQNRWNKSFYREMIWTAKSWHGHNKYLLYDLTMQFVLPFMLLIGWATTAWRVVATGNLNYLWRYLGLVLVVGLFRTLYGLYRTRDPGFLLFMAYGFVHLFLLVPTRLYALATINRTGWGTR